MKKLIYAIVAMLAMAGCYKDNHEFQDGYGALSLGLQWDNPKDAGTVPHVLTVSIQGDGASFTKRFANPEQLASEPIMLPAGEYDILVTADMAEADGFVVEGLPASKAGSGLGEVAVSLANPSSSPSQAWFSVNHAAIKEGEVTPVEPKLQRLLASLDLKIANVPSATSIKKTLLSITKTVILTEKGHDGRYGAPQSKPSGSVSLKDGITNMLPSAAGVERNDILMLIKTADGKELLVTLDVPRIDVGKTYTLNLDFNTLLPYMFIDSGSISPWEDGWTVNGEILNPED